VKGGQPPSGTADLNRDFLKNVEKPLCLRCRAGLCGRLSAVQKTHVGFQRRLLGFQMQASWLAGHMAGQLAGQLDGWLAGWLASWLAGHLAGQLAGQLAGWLAGGLASWLAGWLVSSARRFEAEK